MSVHGVQSCPIGQKSDGAMIKMINDKMIKKIKFFNNRPVIIVTVNISSDVRAALPADGLSYRPGRRRRRKILFFLFRPQHYRRRSLDRGVYFVIFYLFYYCTIGDTRSDNPVDVS